MMWLPLNRHLFRLGNLVSRHCASQFPKPVTSIRPAAPLRQLVPLVSLRQIALNATSCLVERSKIGLGMTVPLFRCLRKPNGCLFVIGSHALPMHVKKAKPVLCIRITLLRCFE